MPTTIRPPSGADRGQGAPSPWCFRTLCSARCRGTAGASLSRSGTAVGANQTRWGRFGCRSVVVTQEALAAGLTGRHGIRRKLVPSRASRWPQWFERAIDNSAAQRRSPSESAGGRSMLTGMVCAWMRWTAPTPFGNPGAAYGAPCWRRARRCFVQKSKPPQQLAAATLQDLSGGALKGYLSL